MEYWILSFLCAIGIIFYNNWIKIIYFITKKTKTELDDKIISAIEFPVKLTLFLLMIYFLLEYLNVKIFDNILLTLTAISFVYIFYKIVDVISKHLESKEEKVYKTIAFIFKNVGILILVFVAVSFITTIWKIDITPLIASAGIAGLIVGFALKDVIENIFAGVLILLDPPFKVGDIVQIGNDAGRVVEIGIRNTKIKKFDNNIIVIPNRDIITSKVTNMCLPDEIVRIEMFITASYFDEPEKVKKVILDLIKSLDGVLEEPTPSVQTWEYGDFYIKYRITFYTTLSNKIKLIDEFNTKIWKKFKEEGITFPFPTHDVYLHK
jgi:MscS family membrane protein